MDEQGKGSLHALVLNYVVSGEKQRPTAFQHLRIDLPSSIIYLLDESMLL